MKSRFQNDLWGSTEECVPLSESEERLLNQFLELNDENRLKFVFLNLSVTGLTEKDHARYNTVYRFCDGHGIQYVDYNKMFYEELNLETDFADSGRLNASSTQKFTIDFVKFILVIMNNHYEQKEGFTNETGSFQRNYPSL